MRGPSYLTLEDTQPLGEPPAPAPAPIPQVAPPAPMIPAGPAPTLAAGRGGGGRGGGGTGGFSGNTWNLKGIDVAGEIDRITASGSPLMRQAAGFGMAMAAKRGLQNSSIAAGTAQGEVLKSASAIGMKQADIDSSHNLQTMADNAAMARVGAQEAGALERAKLGIASNEKIATWQITAEMAKLDKQITADFILAEKGDIAAMERLKVDITSRENLAIKANENAVLLQEMGDTSAFERAQLSETGATERTQLQIDADLARQSQADTAAMDRLDVQNAAAALLQAQADGAALTRQREELSFRTDLSEAERADEMIRLDKQIASNLALQTQAEQQAWNIAGFNAANQKTLAQMDIDASKANANLDATVKMNLGQMEIDANAKNNALSGSVQLQSAYMNALMASMNNENIPAGVRAEFQNALKAATEASLGTLEQITGTDLSWGNNLFNTAPPPGTAANTSSPGGPYDPTQGSWMTRADGSPVFVPYGVNYTSGST